MEYFAHTCQHQHITLFMWLILDFINELSITDCRVKLLQKICTSVSFFHIGNRICDVHIIADREMFYINYKLSNGNLKTDQFLADSQNDGQPFHSPVHNRRF